MAGKQPTKYVAITVGKMSLTDYFDNNSYSHDARTQFLCWGLMANGAWDYAANTRGYTSGIVLEYVTPKTELRYNISLLPLTANGPKMNTNLAEARAQNIEYTKKFKKNGRDGAIRLIVYLNNAKMGNYKESLLLNSVNPDVTTIQTVGRTKYGFGINAEQALTDNLGAFFRASWNDGNNEIWALTQIDRSISIGLSENGSKWKRTGR